MKYSCYGCRYKENNGKYPCTTCGKYVLSPDGEGTVFIYNNWTSDEDAFIKDKISTFQYKDLNNKVLIMKVIDSKEGLSIAGTDVNTGITYVLFSQPQ